MYYRCFEHQWRIRLHPALHWCCLPAMVLQELSNHHQDLFSNEGEAYNLKEELLAFKKSEDDQRNEVQIGQRHAENELQRVMNELSDVERKIGEYDDLVRRMI